jgi:salicylate hydroxylase
LSRLSIGIIGAGPGGLAAALACHHAGLHDVTLYERAPAPEALGAGIQLSPNASRVLIALGLREDFERAASLPQAVHFRAQKSGYLIAMRPLGRFSADRYGAPYWHVHRADLMDILSARAHRLGISLHTDHALETLEQDECGVSLTFTNSQRARHDLLIGADGIHSRVRALTVGEAPARFTGHLAWRGLVPRERLPEKLLEPVVTVWLGPGAHFVNYFVRGGTLVNFVAVIEDPSWQGESWREPGDPQHLAADFARWHPLVERIISNADDVHRWALHDRPALDQWTHGRVTLLGDACHPMLPYLAQGAAMAIEDAWVLARLLEQHDDEPAFGLNEYARFRQARTARVQAASRDQGEDFHRRDRLAILRRNLVLGLGSRYLPELAMQRFDWLHGYDCIRGFH